MRLVVEIPPAPGAPLSAGQAYDLTLRAVTATGEVAPTFTGMVVVETTDPASLLNGLVVDFAAEHAGLRTIPGIAELATPGSQTVTARSVLGPPVEGRLLVDVVRIDRGKVVVALPDGPFAVGDAFVARIFVDMGPSDGNPTTFRDVLGA